VERVATKNQSIASRVKGVPVTIFVLFIQKASIRVFILNAFSAATFAKRNFCFHSVFGGFKVQEKLFHFFHRSNVPVNVKKLIVFFLLKGAGADSVQERMNQRGGIFNNRANAIMAKVRLGNFVFHGTAKIAR